MDLGDWLILGWFIIMGIAALGTFGMLLYTGWKAVQ